MTEPRAKAPDANQRSEDKPGASYISAQLIGSMIRDQNKKAEGLSLRFFGHCAVKAPLHSERL